MNPFVLTSDQWLDILYSLAIIVVTAVVGNWVVHLVLRKALGRLLKRTRTTLDDAILKSVKTPLYLLAITIATEFAIRRLDFLPEDWMSVLYDVFYILYFLFVFGAVWLFVVNLFKWYSTEIAPNTETDLDEQLIPFVSRVAQIALAVIGLIILLSHFSVNVSALVTTLGVGSLAIALAAQAALADTVSGFVIMIDRPFRIGDRIELVDLGTWGDVADIGLRSSRIRTRDNRMVIIPNSVIGKSPIVNHSYPDDNYRLEVQIGLGYGTDIHEARRVISEAVRRVDGVMEDRPVDVLFLEFGDSSLNFRVRWWLDSYIDTRRMYDRVNSAIYDAVKAAGIELPYPQRVLHHEIAPEQMDTIAARIKK
ncbi:MAG TPA: mechanosensitive ion channel domain-containing protein [Anaerolineales bacterium]|nr:mechanosensitive ion channel domain-containing protein [Anaerolineales bacterium]